MKGIKVFLVVLISAISLVSFSQDVTVTWWYESVTPDNLKAMEENLVKPFEESHPGIKIEIIVKNQLQEVLRTAIIAGQGPDIIMTMGPAEANRYASAGYLLPLDEYLEKTGLLEEIPKMFLEVGKVGGKIYSIPKTMESMGVIYNKTLFEKYGLKEPKNRQEWLELNNSVKAQGILPIGAGNANWKPTNEHYVTLYLNHYAGPENVYKALKGELRWDDTLFVEAIEMLKTDFEKYWPKYEIYSVLNPEDFVPMVSMGQSAMFLVGTWGFQWVIDPDYWPSDDEFGWFPFPSLREDVPYPLADIGIGTTLSVNRNSPNSEEAAEFISWTLAQNKQGIANLLRDFPGEWIAPIEIPEEVVPNDVDPIFYEHVQTQYDLLQKGNYGYTTWTFLGPETWQWCYEGIEQVWLNKITPEEYMSKWQEIFTKELKEGLVPPIPERR